MNPLIVSLSPFSFPNGGAIWSCQLSKLYDKNVCIPFTDISIIHKVYDKYYFDKEINNEDCTIIGGPPFPYDYDIKDFLKLCPKPIISMIHDTNDVAPRCKLFWNDVQNLIDGFLVNRDETYLNLPSYIHNKPYLRIRAPYSHVSSKINLDKKEEICFSGRIVPDKGARQVALLTDFGFTVYIMGQKVDNNEYLQYYKLVETTGAIMIPNPTEKEKQAILDRCAFYVAFTYHPEKNIAVEYSALEAMDFGCYPVIANWMTKYYDLSGLYYSRVENTSDSFFAINEMLDIHKSYKELFDAKIISNRNNILNWFDLEFQKINNFVESLRENGKV